MADANQVDLNAAVLHAHGAQTAGDVTSAAPDGMVFSDLIIDNLFLQYIVDTFDASTVKVPAGAITLTVYRNRHAHTLENLLLHPNNKPGDVMTWSGLRAQDRETMINFQTSNNEIADSDVATASEIMKRKVATLILTYMVHGSLSGIMLTPPQVSSYALRIADLDANAFTAANVASYSGFHRMKLRSCLINFISLMDTLPDTLKSRLSLGFAGNRLFSVAYRLREQIDSDTELSAEWKTLLAAPVCERAPFVSFHPDHPRNPMKDCSKWMFATMGRIAESYTGGKDALFESDTATFIPGVVRAMSAPIETVKVAWPNVEAFRGATRVGFSVRTATQPAPQE